MDSRSHRLVVPKTARYLTKGSESPEPDEVWFLCHGYGQLADEFIGQAGALASPRRWLVAPEALSRFYHEDHVRIGASWMTREEREHEMEDYLRYWELLCAQIFALVERERSRVVLLGFSQGAATAARFAARGGTPVDHLVLWGAALPPELDDPDSLAPLGRMRVTLVRGRRDRLFSESAHDEQRERLKRHGISFTEESFGGGHRLDDETLLRVAEIR